MRSINELIWHCTATPEGREVSVKEIDTWHRARGWSGIGYHKVVHLNGSVENGRPISAIGAHVEGHNTGTIGFVYVGGTTKDGTAKDTRTTDQKSAMLALTKNAISEFKLRKVTGHREYAAKACPCFDAYAEYNHLITGTVASGVVLNSSFDDRLRYLQVLLKKLRFYDGMADGILGIKTKDATIKFQAEYGLKKTAELDDATVSKLRELAE